MSFYANKKVVDLKMWKINFTNYKSERTKVEKKENNGIVVSALVMFTLFKSITHLKLG